jgi:hypothetical protein
MNNYQSNDDLLADADDVAGRQAWEFEEPGDLLAADKADIEYYCNKVDYEREEREMEARDEEYLKTPEQKAADAIKKKEEQDNYDYVFKGIIREGFMPTDKDIRKRSQLLADGEQTKNVPFPFE